MRQSQKCLLMAFGVNLPMIVIGGLMFHGGSAADSELSHYGANIPLMLFGGASFLSGVILLPSHLMMFVACKLKEAKDDKRNREREARIRSLMDQSIYGEPRGDWAGEGAVQDLPTLTGVAVPANMEAVARRTIKRAPDGTETTTEEIIWRNRERGKPDA